MDALDSFEDLSEMGHHLADLEVEPRYGKMILYGVVLKCLDPILTIASTMSYKDPCKNTSSALLEHSNCSLCMLMFAMFLSRSYAGGKRVFATRSAESEAEFC